MDKSAKELNKEIFAFVEKCQMVQGMTFNEAIDLWFDLAPLRGADIIERGSEGFGPSKEQTKSSPSSTALPSLPLSVPSEVLTVKEACYYLRLSRATLYRLDPPGKVKLGGKTCYVKAELDEWVRRNRNHL